MFTSQHPCDVDLHGGEIQLGGMVVHLNLIPQRRQLGGIDDDDVVGSSVLVANKDEVNKFNSLSNVGLHVFEGLDHGAG